MNGRQSKNPFKVLAIVLVCFSLFCDGASNIPTERFHRRSNCGPLFGRGTIKEVWEEKTAKRSKCYIS